jgi:hypothetical protein
VRPYGRKAGREGKHQEFISRVKSSYNDCVGDVIKFKVI